MESLDYYAQAQDKLPGADLDSGVSVVALPPIAATGQEAQVVLVQWTIPGQEGRIADLDQNDRIKCIVPVGSKRNPTNFASLGAEIIIPATGAKVLRERRFKANPNPFQKNLVQPVVLNLMKMLRICQSKLLDDAVPSGLEALLPPGGGDPCFICRKGSDVDAAEGGEGPGSSSGSVATAQDYGSGPVSLCPFCMTCSHASCCRTVLHAGSIASQRSRLRARLMHYELEFPAPMHCTSLQLFPSLLREVRSRRGIGVFIVATAFAAFTALR